MSKTDATGKRSELDILLGDFLALYSNEMQTPKHPLFQFYVLNCTRVSETLGNTCQTDAAAK